MANQSRPRTLREAIRFFSDPERCLTYAAAMRWPGGVVCPTCGRKDVTFLGTRRVWKCRIAHPRQQFSVKAGTIFEDSSVGLDKWFAVIWMVANHPEGISSYATARELGVTQKTAWHMMRRIRAAMRTASFETAVMGDTAVTAPSVVRARSIEAEAGEARR